MISLATSKGLEELQRQAFPPGAYALSVSLWPAFSQNRLDELQARLERAGVELLAPVSLLVGTPATLEIKLREKGGGFGAIPAIPTTAAVLLAFTVLVGAAVIGLTVVQLSETVQKLAPWLVLGGVLLIYLQRQKKEA